eukprot:Pgem_evm1s10022
MAKNCASHNHREIVVQDLMNTIGVDSFSSCLHNKQWPEGYSALQSKNWYQAKIHVMKSYKFHLAFENQNTAGHITEKLWLALMSGTLPIYLGATDVLEHVPTKSIILVQDFENNEELGKYLKYLANNETAYNEYHDWRYKPMEKKWFDKYDQITRVDYRCRSCRYVYAMNHNLTWCHNLQHFENPNNDYCEINNATEY